VSHCLYHTIGDDYKSVSVLVRRGAAGENARDGLAQIRSANALGGAFEPVAGLGDEALWHHGGDSDQLSAAKGRFLVITSGDLGKGVPTLDISKAVAERVLARLP
jgi:Xaa-Pro aminopeptidase